MRALVQLLLALGLAAFPSAAASAEAQAAPQARLAPVTVVAHPSVTARSLSRSELSNLFLKRRSHWPDGQRAVPVDQTAGGRAHAAFSQTVHRRGAVAVKAFWEQQIFSGNQIPPPARATDRDVVEFVLANPGAVGYVIDATSASGLVVLTISHE